MRSGSILSVFSSSFVVIHLLLLLLLLGCGSVFVSGYPIQIRSTGSRAHTVPRGVLMRLRGGAMAREDDLPLHQYTSSGGESDLSEEDIRSAHEDSLALYKAMSECKDGYIAERLRSAMEILSDAIRVYGPDQVFSSFNGGKDAVVIMHIMRAVVAKYSADHGCIHRPQFIYFAIDDEFPEVLEHIDDTTRTCALHLTKYACNIKVGLQQHVEKMKADGLNTPAFALGTRRADPNCGTQEAFSPSSSWMPAFMRVNPILDWEYGHVWHFLRTFKLPYCSLYDEGYTSLGKKGDTRPNPALRRKHLLVKKEQDQEQEQELVDSDSDMYWPAYMLSDWSLERAGRGASSSGSGEASSGESCNADLDETTNNNVSNGGGGGVGAVSEPVTAGLLIIGDEILNGFTQETNLLPATKALASIGVPIQRVSIVPDNEEEIVEEVLRLTQRYDFLITSGGVGPTHDDVTLKGVAKALGGRAIVESQEMLRHLEKVSAKPAAQLEEGVRGLAQLPEGSELLFPPPISDGGITTTTSTATDESPSSSKPWPVLKVENIFVLPGVPQFFAEQIGVIAKHFVNTRGQNEVGFGKNIVLGVEESIIVSILNQLVERYPLVKIGSYPYVDDPAVKTIITVKGPLSRAMEVETAVQDLISQLPKFAVLRVEN